MNEVMKALLERRSIRKFKPDALTKEQLGQIVEAGLYAASGKGAQSAIAVVVTNKALRDRLSAENCRIGGWEEGFDPFYGAPAIILVLANKNEPNHVYDGSLMMGNMMLAAHALGLGSIWINRAKQEFDMPEYQALLKELGIEGEWEGIAHLAGILADQEQRVELHVEVQAGAAPPGAGHRAVHDVPQVDRLGMGLHLVLPRQVDEVADHRDPGGGRHLH